MWGLEVLVFWPMIKALIATLGLVNPPLANSTHRTPSLWGNTLSEIVILYD